MEKGHHSPIVTSSINDPTIYVFYRYDPCFSAAVLTSVGFLLTTLVHFYKASKYRTYYFMPFIVGGLFDTFGFAVRTQAHYYPYSIAIYIAQTLLILLAPALLAASIYMTLERIILFTQGEMLSPIPARWLTRIFVCGDMLSFVVQASGGGLMATKYMALGQHLVVLALIIQITSFGLFMITAVIFHYNIAFAPTQISYQVKWQKYMYAVYAASTLIFIRSIFRVVEFSEGNDGFLMRQEYLMYLFEGVLMACVTLCFHIAHPGELMGRQSTEEVVNLQTRLSKLGGSTSSLTDRESV